MLIASVALEIEKDNACFPRNNEEASFYIAWAACQSKNQFLETGLTQTQYINGLLHYFGNTTDLSDTRLQPCVPVLGVKRLTMRSGRQNALSLVTDFLASSK